MSDNVSYWSRKKYALEELLAAAPKTPDKDTVAAWALKLFGNTTATPETTGLKGILDQALLDLEKLRLEITAAETLGAKRRSARLVSIVQKAIGATPTGSGFYASVADATFSNVSNLNDYRSAVQAASEALANFYAACRNDDDPAPIASALTTVLGGTPLKHVPKQEITGLIKSLKSITAKHPGGGEGDSTWPSTQPPGSSTTPP